MRCAPAFVVFALLLGCRQHSEAPPPSLEPEASPNAPSAPEAYGPDVASLRVVRSIVVRAAPDPAAPPLGTIAQDTRVLWQRTRSGPGCEGAWVEIAPRGWVCDRYLEPNFRPPRALTLPKVADGEVVPGSYGSIVGRRTRVFATVTDARRGVRGRGLAQSALVRVKRELQVGRRTYFRTASGQLVDARRVIAHSPSRFAGIDLTVPSAPLLPLAWTSGGVTVWEERQKWIDLGALPPRTLVPLIGRSTEHATVRIARWRWVDEAALKVARLSEVPSSLAPHERWIDVDLEQQVLVAYEGSRPVFATLVSSGSRNPTPLGEYRIWVKFAEATLDGVVNGRSYQVEDVPWVMFFHGDFALHGVYWHDKFGAKASNGCINLSPQDARFLYHWTSPSVPDGWTMAHSTADAPGTLVRIRHGPAAPKVATAELAAVASDAPSL